MGSAKKEEDDVSSTRPSELLKRATSEEIPGGSDASMNMEAPKPAVDEHREAFIEAAIQELKKRPDLEDMTTSKDSPKVKKNSLAKLDAREVVRSLCYDFPTVESDECATLAAALRDKDWRLKGRLSYRCPRGVRQLTQKRGTSAGASDLAGALGVSAVKAVLEMPRSHLVRFASKPFFGDDDLAAMSARRKQAEKPKVEAPTKNLDYSKWDQLASDSDEDDDRMVREMAAQQEKKVSVDTYDVSVSLPIENAKDGLLFFLELTKVAEATALSSLDGDDKWKALLGEIKDVALALRGDDSLEGGWLLAKDDDGRLRQEYERYVFLARDVCLSVESNVARKMAAKLLVDLALESSGGSRSARDGGVALVAIATLSPAAARATAEVISEKKIREEASIIERDKQNIAEDFSERKKKNVDKKQTVSTMSANAQALSVFRETARLVLPAVAELVRAVAHDRGDGDESLLGASLAILETANGISTTADANAIMTTGTTQHVSAHFSTHFEALQGGASPTMLIETGLLAGLCALTVRLKAEALTATSESTDLNRAHEAEVRLHRILVSCAAQSPDKIGAFLARATALLEVIYDPTFVDRCPCEAALWCARLGCVDALNNNSNNNIRGPKTTTQRTMRRHATDPRLDDLLRQALPVEAIASDKDDDRLLPRLRVANQVLRHLNATKPAASAWLDTSAYANDYFLRLRDAVLLVGNNKTISKAPPDQGTAPSKDDDDHVPEEDLPDAKKKLRAAAREKIFSQLRRELKVLPLAEAASTGLFRGEAPATKALAPQNVRGKLD